MIYKSYCAINIAYYPFDIQNCTLKFGTWTYHVSRVYEFVDSDGILNPFPQGLLVNLQFLTNNESTVLERGWDLEDYVPSIEWEILSKYMKVILEDFHHRVFRLTSYSTRNCLCMLCGSLSRSNIRLHCPTQTIILHC